MWRKVVVSKLPRITNDTNVWLSALYFSGKPAKIVNLKVLETAVVGKCQWLITGDKDLLTLKNYDNINIVTPAQFLSQYNLN